MKAKTLPGKLLKGLSLDSLKHGWGSLSHSALALSVVVISTILVERGLTAFAVALLLISKWRVLAVSLRYWIPNIRANIPDLVVGLGLISQIDSAANLTSGRLTWILIWSGAFAFWQLYIKPKSSELMVGIQAITAQFIGLMLIFNYSDRLAEVVMILAVWVVAVTSARHFFSSYEEPFVRVSSYAWGLFMVQLAWLLNRWLIVYDLFPTFKAPQIAVITLVLQYSLGSIYHHHKTETLKKTHIKQFLVFSCAILLMVILFSNWTGNL